MPRKPLSIPIVDVFAGPGGLAEGFASLVDNRVKFHVALSVEKDVAAWRTLKLRHFFRQFPRDAVPKEYYDYIRCGGDSASQTLFSKYPTQHAAASKASLNLELDNRSHDVLIYQSIEELLSDQRIWVLVGGPRCQAYSIVGRSRRTFEQDDDAGRQEFEDDERHYL